MSHQYYNPARTRLQRSELAVPGSSPKMFEKALNSDADRKLLMDAMMVTIAGISAAMKNIG